MIQTLVYDDEAEKTIDEWLGDNSAPRKKYIVANDFDLIKL